MNVHFWFHALSEIPDIIVWVKNRQYLEASRTRESGILPDWRRRLQHFITWCSAVHNIQKFYLFWIVAGVAPWGIKLAVEVVQHALVRKLYVYFSFFRFGSFVFSCIFVPQQGFVLLWLRIPGTWYLVCTRFVFVDVDIRMDIHIGVGYTYRCQCRCRYRYRWLYISKFSVDVDIGPFVDIDIGAFVDIPLVPVSILLPISISLSTTMSLSITYAGVCGVDSYVGFGQQTSTAVSITMLTSISITVRCRCRYREWCRFRLPCRWQFRYRFSDVHVDDDFDIDNE